MFKCCTILLTLPVADLVGVVQSPHLWDIFSLSINAIASFYVYNAVSSVKLAALENND